MTRVRLGDLIRPAGARAGAEVHLPVYSVTKHRGFVPSREYFKKQVFSKELRTYKVVEPGDFAYATIHLDEGSIGIAPTRGLISPMYTIFSVDPARVDPRFLFRFLKAPDTVARYATLGRGTAERRKSIGLDSLGRLELELPPLLEQRRIGQLLDQTDEIHSMRLRAAHLQRDALDEIYREMFPSALRLRTLGELGRWQSGGTPSRQIPEYFEGSVPWATSGELGQLRISDSKEHISAEALQKTSAKLISPGSVLLGMYDTAALKSSITTVEMACNQAIAFVHLGPEVNAEYLYFAIQRQRPAVLEMRRGIRQKNLNLSILRSISVEVPPLRDQEVFADLVRRQERASAQSSQHSAALEELSRSLQHDTFGVSV